MTEQQAQRQIEIDTEASFPARVNGQIVVRWQSILESWWDGIDRTSLAKWVLWELTWPIFILSTLLFYAYLIVSTPAVYALTYWYVSVPVAIAAIAFLVLG